MSVTDIRKRLLSILKISYEESDAELFQKFAYSEVLSHIKEFSYRIISGAPLHMSQVISKVGRDELNEHNKKINKFDSSM